MTRIRQIQTSTQELAKGGHSETKISMVRRLLARKAGADLKTLCGATGWQAHSVRAALSGLRKAGVTLERSASKVEGGTAIYRIAAATAAAA